MKLLPYLFVLSSLVLFFGCGTQKPLVENTEKGFTNVISAYDAHNATTESVVYALPMTMLRFTLNVEKVYKRRGPLYRYSNLYLDAEELVTENETLWRLKSVNVKTVGLADNTKVFKVDFKGNTGSGNIELAENGCIKSINVNMEEEFEIVKEVKLCDDAEPDTSFAKVPMTEELLRANSTAKMAEEAAAYIYRLRENRTALVSGELDYFPQDGKSLELSLNEMRFLENEFVSLFTGKVDKEQIEINFDYVPDAAVTKETLFRFSRFKGLVPSDDFSGSPVLITLTPDQLLNLPDNEAEPIYDEKGELLEMVKKNGFFYRVPMQSTLMLEYNGQPLMKEKLQIAQFGKTLSLPADLLDNNDKGIIFYPETGAIKKIINKN